CFFFFQAEDGIRDKLVTGVQTCALPICLGRVTGLGLNAAEMADNPQLDEYVIHDLNRTPRLPFPDASFDAVVCAVSVQYLVRPWDVFADVRRIVRAGGPLVVSFSD